MAQSAVGGANKKNRRKNKTTIYAVFFRIQPSRRFGEAAACDYLCCPAMVMVMVMVLATAYSVLPFLLRFTTQTMCSSTMEWFDNRMNYEVKQFSMVRA